jgi:hypothetical protein
MKAPTATSTIDTIRRKVARGTLWASFAPYHDPTVSEAARTPPNTKSSSP